MDSSLKKFKDDFVSESSALLDNLEGDLLKLENHPDDISLIESVFRTMHTIKGAGSMFGFDIISRYTHDMESLYQMIRDNKMQFDHNIFDITFQSVDHIRKLLFDENLSESVNKQKHEELLASISNLLGAPQQSMVQIKKAEETENQWNTWHIILYATESILLRGIKLLNIIHELSAYGDYQLNRIENENDEESDNWSILVYTKASEKELHEVFLFVEDDCTIVKLTPENILKTNKSEEQKYQAPSTEEISILDYIEGYEKNKTSRPGADLKEEKPEKTEEVEKMIRKRISVDSVKLDQLMFLVSELITVNSQLNLSTHDSQFNSIRPYLEKIDTLSKQFRNNAFEIRLVPLGDTVLRFQRLIRDLSKQLNKKINFVTHGTGTELDKNTIDQLTEPLMHIIRNCIDHGIESPEIRSGKGKAEAGTITMEAFYSGNNVIINISDDGCGIDNEKVKQKAIDKGYIKPGDNPGQKELYDFIFMPGFSTAQTLTSISGRGVGMDVVRQRVNQLRGDISVSSQFGMGTTFSLKLQQSMSIVDSLLFNVENCFFTVPITEIAICEQVESNYITGQQHTSTLTFNDHLIPYIDLRRMFLLNGEYPRRLKTIIIRNNEKEMALLCDRIIGEHQAVLKPLGKSFSDQEYITAASQMGNGNMAFMLDTNKLLNLCMV